MIVKDYIAQLFGGFKIPLNEAALISIASSGLDLNDEVDDMSKETYDKIMLAVLEFAPLLIVSPTSYSVSENGHSKSYGFNMQGFKEWYSLMCRKYGLKDELSTEKPRIRFI